MRKILAALSVFILCLGVLLVSVNFVAYNKSFYDTQFKANGTAERLAWILEEQGISQAEVQAELNNARDKIIDYISGKTEVLGIEFFTEDELSHMADARAVFIAVRIAAYVLTACGVAGLAALFIVKGLRDRRMVSGAGKINPLFGGIIWGSGAFLCLMALIGVVTLLGFDGAFTVFHEIFFPQGNWQFSSDSAMIIMLPESLFINAVWIIAGSGIVFAAVLHIAAWVLALSYKRKQFLRK